MNSPSVSRLSPIEGVRYIKETPHRDDRGIFYECARTEKLGIPPVVQINCSYSVSRVIRGLHMMTKNPQGKLITVTQGRIQDVFLDLRKGSATFGKFDSAILEAGKGESLYLPPGIAHGFAVLSVMATMIYGCTSPYDPEFDSGIRYDDLDLQIPWLVEDPVVSAKDRALPSLNEFLYQMQ